MKTQKKEEPGRGANVSECVCVCVCVGGCTCVCVCSERVVSCKNMWLDKQWRKIDIIWDRKIQKNGQNCRLTWQRHFRNFSQLLNFKSSKMMLNMYKSLPRRLSESEQWSIIDILWDRQTEKYRTWTEKQIDKQYFFYTILFVSKYFRSFLSLCYDQWSGSLLRKFNILIETTEKLLDIWFDKMAILNFPTSFWKKVLFEQMTLII
jgi:hypothetical protein